VLLRLVYLSVTNVFALLPLLAASDRGKDVEILVLRRGPSGLLGRGRGRAERGYLAVDVPADRAGRL
jgi:hypothetical protein